MTTQCHISRPGHDRHNRLVGTRARRALPVLALMCALSALLVHRPAGAQVVSPGKLAKAHAHLEGSKNCKQCHSRRGRVEPQLCFDCHTALAEAVKASRGFHASRGSSRCGSCHQDHRGRKFDIIRWPTGSPERFNHKLVRYDLRGKHGESKCRDCHLPKYQVSAKVKRWPMARRQRTYLGLERDCTSCHEDEHDGRLGQQCQKCHDERQFKEPPRFDHDDARFVLRGKHKDVECDDCHKKPGRTPEVMYRGIAYKTCDSCHEEPHKGAMANRAGKTVCDSCHTETAWNRLIYKRTDHSPRRMPLRGGHAKPGCTDCHGQKASKQPSTACASCHQDVHGNRFGKDCGRCHDIDSWRARPPRQRTVPAARVDASARLGLTRKDLSKVEFHQKTDFPLVGLHVKVACDKCHPRSRRGFRKRFQDIAHEFCADCHKDPHAGQFKDTRCRQCHTTDGWPLTTYGHRQHDKSQFPLDGAHRSVACVQCHTRERPDATRYRFQDRGCAVCHQDQHEGQFDTEVDAKRPQRKCAECHATSSFAPSTFDHDRSRLPLEGAHEQTACASCHRKSRGELDSGQVPAGKIIYRGMSPECESCHRDRHQGQFRRPPTVRLCGECHTQKNFEIATFDHDNQTNYNLTGKHKNADCSACHFKVELQGGAEIALYRLGEKSCAECHANRHESRDDRLRGPAKRSALGQSASSVAIDACERCHTTDGWPTMKLVQGFDHSAVGYALRGGHDAVGCDRCHRAGQALTRQCSGCHQDRHAGRLGGDCAGCHDATSWRATDIRANHRMTRLPLTGGHALTDCTSCHPRDRQGQYVAVPVACVGCHRDEYQDTLTHPNHREAGFGIECQECHRPAGWSPAFFAHATFPLRGAHRVTSCGSCHDRTPVPRECESCHQADLALAVNPDHTAIGFPSDCGMCHSESAWTPSDFPLHEQSFPIARGNHSGFECSECHTNPSDTTDFTCLAPCHTRPDMDDEHNDVTDYVYESRACLECHPDGTE